MIPWLMASFFWMAGGGQALDDVVLPRKTEIFLTLERSISTKTATAGDRVHGRVSVPVTQDDRIVIPVGSYILGRVDFSRQPGRLKGKGELILIFDTVILPDGTTRQMEAVVQSAEGHRTDRSGERGELETSGSQSGEVAEGAATGAVVGATVGAVAGRDLKGAGVGAAIGSGAGALLGLFRRGEDVVLQRGTSLTVQLSEDTRFVRPTAPSRGRPLGP